MVPAQQSAFLGQEPQQFARDGNGALPGVGFQAELRRGAGARPPTGLHALVRLERQVSVGELMTRAAERSVGVYPLPLHMISPPERTDALVMGYANLSEPAIEEGVCRLAAVLTEL